MVSLYRKESGEGMIEVEDTGDGRFRIVVSATIGGAVRKLDFFVSRGEAKELASFLGGDGADSGGAYRDG